MAGKKRGKSRPFQLRLLNQHALPVLLPRMGPGESVWRYTVTVPLEEIQPRKRQRGVPWK